MKDSSSPRVENIRPETDDVSLILSFALRKRLLEGNAWESESSSEHSGRVVSTPRNQNPRGELIDAANREEFVAYAAKAFARFEQKDILRRAIAFTNAAGGESIEISFISLYAALESTLTFFRHEGRYKILARDEFARLERDLKKWLRQHPLLEHDSARRALIYEKVKELNRFPFSHVFKRFCHQYSVGLSDLWPVSGRPEEWPLAEVRHRLVHGDPFVSRPLEAVVCAEEHLRWTVERMILSVLGWPVSRTHASEQYLSNVSAMHRNWRAERAKFA